jgi:hypothetical protein
MTTIPGIDVSVEPSGETCVECEASGGWWVHLRRCAACGHIGCCDTSPAQHATAHNAATGHPVIRSFEPGEDWFYDYPTGETFRGPQLAGVQHRPSGQSVPGPAGRVPSNWQDLMH